VDHGSEGTDPAEVLVVMGPTRNAWVPIAAWFRRHGARRRPGSAGGARRICLGTTPSTARPTGWTPKLLAGLPMLHADGPQLIMKALNVGRFPVAISPVLGEDTQGPERAR
jgi:hypothetical protein